MSDLANFIAAQVGFLTAEVFLVGLYVQRRFGVETEARERTEAVEACVAANDRAGALAGHRNLTDLLDGARPYGSADASGTRRLLILGSNLILATIAVAYMMLWWLALKEADAASAYWIGDNANLAASSSSLLMIVTVSVFGVGWLLLRGRSQVVARLSLRSQEACQRSRFGEAGQAPRLADRVKPRFPAAPSRSAANTRRAQGRALTCAGLVVLIYCALRGFAASRLLRRPR